MGLSGFRRAEREAKEVAEKEAKAIEEAAKKIVEEVYEAPKVTRPYVRRTKSEE